MVVLLVLLTCCFFFWCTRQHNLPRTVTNERKIPSNQFHVIWQRVQVFHHGFQSLRCLEFMMKHEARVLRWPLKQNHIPLRYKSSKCRMLFKILICASVRVFMPLWKKTVSLNITGSRCRSPKTAQDCWRVKVSRTLYGTSDLLDSATRTRTRASTRIL